MSDNEVKPDAVAPEAVAEEQVDAAEAVEEQVTGKSSFTAPRIR